MRILPSVLVVFIIVSAPITGERLFRGVILRGFLSGYSTRLRSRSA